MIRHSLTNRPEKKSQIIQKHANMSDDTVSLNLNENNENN